MNMENKYFSRVSAALIITDAGEGQHCAGYQTTNIASHSAELIFHESSCLQSGLFTTTSDLLGPCSLVICEQSMNF